MRRSSACLLLTIAVGSLLYSADIVTTIDDVCKARLLAAQARAGRAVAAAQARAAEQTQRLEAELDVARAAKSTQQQRSEQLQQQLDSIAKGVGGGVAGAGAAAAAAAPLLPPPPPPPPAAVVGLGALPAFIVMLSAMKETDSTEFTEAKQAGSRKGICQEIWEHPKYWKTLIGTGGTWFLYDVSYYGTASCGRVCH